MALKNDIDNVEQIVHESKLLIEKQGPVCWDIKYSSGDNIALDIKEKALFVQEIERRIVGFICVNNKEVEGYESINWSCKDNFLVIHRILVDRRIRRNGVGTMLMKFTDELAKEKGVKSIRVNIYSLNMNAQNFIVNCGYKKVGEIFIHGVKEYFYCYEKIL
ncbi:GNAT family N-acetyltransferase [Clostridium ihumii]